MRNVPAGLKSYCKESYPTTKNLCETLQSQQNVPSHVC